MSSSRNILKEGLKSIEPTERGDSKFTVHHTNSFSVSGDGLALEAHRLKAVGSSPEIKLVREHACTLFHGAVVIPPNEMCYHSDMQCPF